MNQIRNESIESYLRAFDKYFCLLLAGTQFVVFVSSFSHDFIVLNLWTAFLQKQDDQWLYHRHIKINGRGGVMRKSQNKKPASSNFVSEDVKYDGLRIKEQNRQTESANDIHTLKLT